MDNRERGRTGGFADHRIQPSSMPCPAHELEVIEGKRAHHIEKLPADRLAMVRINGVYGEERKTNDEAVSHMKAAYHNR